MKTSALAAVFLAMAVYCLGNTHPRVLVSTDIGGTDPDDFQSLVHLLLYADVLELEGLVSSPYGPGRKQHILEVLQIYEHDYEALCFHSRKYPAPAELIRRTRQGALDPAPYPGVTRATEGSSWIITCARRDDVRPLNVLVWGGIEDVAQALHDAPDILPRLRVYFIGGPNKKWSPNAYQYIVDHHPTLWIIEANATYRGWFVGGDQQGEWGNQAFVRNHVAGRGALGEFFAGHLRGTIKMGDTPSVAWLLQGTPENPGAPGWGGRFVRAWERPYLRLTRLPTAGDALEAFGILDLVLPIPDSSGAIPEATLIAENQSTQGFLAEDRTMRFRFCPKASKTFSLALKSSIPTLDGMTGTLRVVPADPSKAASPSKGFPNWWTDDPAPEWAEGPHPGAKTVSVWRRDALRDFAERLKRCPTKP